MRVCAEVGSLFIAFAMDGGTSVWKSVRFGALPVGSRLTSSETALVDPGMHVGALILELLKLISGVLELVLEVVDLVDIRSDGLVEGLGQWIGSGFHCCGSEGSGTCIGRGDGASSWCGIITLIASGGGSKGL